MMMMMMMMMTILYAGDTNIKEKSTNYNDLHKTVNVSLHLISEWFQIKQFVLNKNKILEVKFSWTKTPTRTVYTVLDNQNLALIESTNFLGMYLDNNLSWTLHGKSIEETDYNMQFYEEFILLSDSRQIKGMLFSTFSVTVAIFWSSPTNLHETLI
jgi:hypothetical protein